MAHRNADLLALCSHEFSIFTETSVALIMSPTIHSGLSNLNYYKVREQSAVAASK